MKSFNKLKLMKTLPKKEKKKKKGRYQYLLKDISINLNSHGCL